jgi:hypothetical protein
VSLLRSQMGADGLMQAVVVCQSLIHFEFVIDFARE